jgi:hypothetical protein
VTKYLGGASAALLTRAQEIYHSAANELSDAIEFECEVGATGGRCAHSTLYWYAAFITHHLHVCPLWMSLGSDEARARDLLSGFYGYKGLGRDWTERANLVGLSHDFAVQSGTDPHLPPPAHPGINPPANQPPPAHP